MSADKPNSTKQSTSGKAPSAAQRWEGTKSDTGSKFSELLGLPDLSHPHAQLVLSQLSEQLGKQAVIQAGIDASLAAGAGTNAAISTQASAITLLSHQIEGAKQSPLRRRSIDDILQGRDAGRQRSCSFS